MLADKVRCSLKKGMLIKGMKCNSFLFFKNLFVGGRDVVCQRRKVQEGTLACWGFMQKNAMIKSISSSCLTIPHGGDWRGGEGRGSEKCEV